MRQHGTSTMYINGPCRCEPCRLAHTKARNRHRLRTLNGERLHVPKVGAIRRIRALMAIGWRLHDIARECGLSDRGSFGSLFSERHQLIHVDTLAQLDAAYERLSGKPGPSNRTRLLAQKHGWPPPLAWDRIDDPDEQPDYGAKPTARGADIDEWLFLVEGGEDPERAAHRLGVQVDAIAQQAFRKGREDIYHLAWSASQRIKNRRAREAAKRKAAA